MTRGIVLSVGIAVVVPVAVVLNVAVAVVVGVAVVLNVAIAAAPFLFLSLFVPLLSFTSRVGFILLLKMHEKCCWCCCCWCCCCC